ncbi:pentapeptide repeat-containing protein [Candidatus Fokinia crypta]|uniref:SV2A/B/C luminal domain-containing protein n=1 Tax=Candidatus Fokinia crypta TaxID=1920990 RepID=A0ABZ0UV34_9RICK|nr:pentapeptide repeat-containing protein [Candidatus Fokinia cryptica]WPX97940.1 hypothetical protein Fokcrypt_00464 [Candidatus Fokinia cryptica]
MQKKDIKKSEMQILIENALKNGEKELDFEKFSKKQIQEVLLSDIDFSGCTIKNLNCAASIFENCKFNGTHFQNSSLTNCAFPDSDFSGAIIDSSRNTNNLFIINEKENFPPSLQIARNNITEKQDDKGFLGGLIGKVTDAAKAVTNLRVNIFTKNTKIPKEDLFSTTIFDAKQKSSPDWVFDNNLQKMHQETIKEKNANVANYLEELWTTMNSRNNKKPTIPNFAKIVEKDMSSEEMNVLSGAQKFMNSPNISDEVAEKVWQTMQKYNAAKTELVIAKNDIRETQLKYVEKEKLEIEPKTQYSIQNEIEIGKTYKNCVFINSKILNSAKEGNKETVFENCVFLDDTKITDKIGTMKFIGCKNTMDYEVKKCIEDNIAQKADDIVKLRNTTDSNGDIFLEPNEDGLYLSIEEQKMEAINSLTKEFFSKLPKEGGQLRFSDCSCNEIEFKDSKLPIKLNNVNAKDIKLSGSLMPNSSFTSIKADNFEVKDSKLQCGEFEKCRFNTLQVKDSNMQLIKIDDSNKIKNKIVINNTDMGMGIIAPTINKKATISLEDQDTIALKLDKRIKSAIKDKSVVVEYKDLEKRKKLVKFYDYGTKTSQTVETAATVATINEVFDKFNIGGLGKATALLTGLTVKAYQAKYQSKEIGEREKAIVVAAIADEVSNNIGKYMAKFALYCAVSSLAQESLGGNVNATGKLLAITAVSKEIVEKATESKMHDKLLEGKENPEKVFDSATRKIATKAVAATAVMIAAAAFTKITAITVGTVALATLTYNKIKNYKVRKFNIKQQNQSIAQSEGKGVINPPPSSPSLTR